MHLDVQNQSIDQEGVCPLRIDGVYAHVRQKILKALRGRRSQVQLSRRLGYGFNQVYRWESGRVQMSWTEFVEFSKACKVDVSLVMRSIFGFEFPPERIDLFLQGMFLDSKTKSVSESLGKSRFMISRWRQGKTIPSLDDVLEVIDKISGQLPEFVSSLVQDADPNAMNPETKRWSDLFAAYPFATAMIASLSLEEYLRFPAHPPGWIAARIGLSEGEEATVLRGLSEIGAIELSDGRYRMSDRFQLRMTAASVSEVARFWCEQNLKSMDTRAGHASESVSGCSVVAVSSASRVKIREALSECFKAIRAIVNHPSNDPKVELHAICVQMNPIRGRGGVTSE